MGLNLASRVKGGRAREKGIVQDHIEDSYLSIPESRNLDPLPT